MLDPQNIGHSFAPFEFEITRGKIHELALAIGDPNPIYHNHEAAQAAGYKDVPLPPTFATVIGFWGEAQVNQQIQSLGVAIERGVHGEEEYEYLARLYPGDTVTGVTSIADYKVRPGSNGTNREILKMTTHYTNQHGQPVLNATHTVIIF